jgi:hypothetical protein
MKIYYIFKIYHLKVFLKLYKGGCQGIDLIIKKNMFNS